MLKYASWVHGNALVLETPNNILIVRRGQGTEMQFIFAPGETPQGTWCHISIPTPVIFNDVRMRVQTLFLLFKTGQHASIDNIHVWDGPTRIATFDFVPGSNNSARRTGDHSRGIDAQNTITLPTPHEVLFGLSISFTFRPVAVNTSLPDVDPEGTLLITTAGADFF
ncbi:MAG TPA: hypothetical protein PLF92_10260 [Arenimonas sp.]|mgnify:CR=1 FL=1|nr:hypothetical protein [Arenimonas sp.]HPW33279.1 hypothetical protein [Arenimonas sp.]